MKRDTEGPVIKRSEDGFYRLLYQQADEMMQAEPAFVPALSNLSALLMDSLPNLNWAGFYLSRGNQLVVGPFQGKPACIHIPIGKGVCGTAAERDKTLIVPDVHQFPGHIACDSASNSEIVIPIHRGRKVAAVLDIDSPRLNRFSEEDEKELTRIVKLIEEKIQWQTDLCSVSDEGEQLKNNIERACNGGKSLL